MLLHIAEPAYRLRPTEFEIRESFEGDWLQLTLLGELDISTSPELEARVKELQAEGRPVLMDLSQLEFMDSAGLGTMINAINTSRSDEWAFAIDPTLSPQVRKLFSLTAVDQFACINGKDAQSA